MQRTPVAHDAPQPPQLFRSSVVSTQTPPHALYPAAQTHWLLTQAWLAPHVAPHSPQLAGSFVRFAHPLVHRARPAPHAAVHIPRLQTLPPWQAVPQVPQLAWLVCRFWQIPAGFMGSPAVQTVSPIWHPQTPFVQLAPVGHALLSAARGTTLSPSPLARARRRHDDRDHELAALVHLRHHAGVLQFLLFGDVCEGVFQRVYEQAHDGSFVLNGWTVNGPVLDFVAGGYEMAEKRS